MITIGKEVILLVEDDESISELVQLHLSNNSYLVDHAATLSEARARLSNQKYAMILLDLMLPDGAGMDLCQ